MLYIFNMTIRAFYWYTKQFTLMIICVNIYFYIYIDSLLSFCSVLNDIIKHEDKKEKLNVISKIYLERFKKSQNGKQPIKR